MTRALRLHLLQRDMLAQDVARMLGTSKHYLSMILNSRRRATSIRRRLIEEIGIPAELVSYNPRADRGMKKAA